MILVLLGTQNNSFIRLLKEIEECISKKIITDKVVVQAGYTNYASANMEILQLVPATDFAQLLEKADLIITHGGVRFYYIWCKIGKKGYCRSQTKKI